MDNSPLLGNMQKAANKTYTANGGLTNKSTLNSNLDYFGSVGAMRGREQALLQTFVKAFGENRETALRNLFYGRDCRGGQGERSSFRYNLIWLANNHPEVVIANIANVAIYGRFDDLFVLMGTPVELEVLAFLRETLVSDVKEVKSGDATNISLLAKWMPSESSSKKALAKKFADAFGINRKKYRQTLTRLRKEIGILETKLSNKDYGSIDYSKIPSRAGMIYRKAFYTNDSARYSSFLDKAVKGETKMNSSTLYPYEITSKVGYGYFSHSSKEDKTLEAAWLNLPNYLEGNEHEGLVIADVSGSMYGRPMDVCLSLAIYIAERNKGKFKNHFMTFSQRPSIEKLVGSTLAEKVKNLSKAQWSMNTDLKKCFELLLNTAFQTNASEEDMPKVLYIVSDMQFDRCCRSNSRTHFEQIQKMYAKAGFTMPKLVFWNVNGNSNVPVTAHDSGTALVSGCSPTLFEQILAGSTPEDVMNKKLYSARYDLIVTG